MSDTNLSLGGNPMSASQRVSRFRNPSNGYEENVGQAWLWCLLLGPIYFAAKGIWLHAATSLLLAIGTGGISWFIYPFFANWIVRKHFLRNGWIAEVKEQPSRTEAMKSRGKALIAIGWIYLILVMMIQSVHQYQTGGWSKFLDISNNWKDVNVWKDAVIFTLIMLPGFGAHKLGEKLQETAAKDELREKLGYSE